MDILIRPLAFHESNRMTALRYHEIHFAPLHIPEIAELQITAFGVALEINPFPWQLYFVWPYKILASNLYTHAKDKRKRHPVFLERRRIVTRVPFSSFVNRNIIYYDDILCFSPRNLCGKMLRCIRSSS
jgi:hypothetical protein